MKPADRNDGNQSDTTGSCIPQQNPSDCPILTFWQCSQQAAPRWLLPARATAAPLRRQGPGSLQPTPNPQWRFPNESFLVGRWCAEEVLRRRARSAAAVGGSGIPAFRRASRPLTHLWPSQKGTAAVAALPGERCSRLT